MIADNVSDVINKKYRTGATHQKIADEHHVSRQFIQRILSGERKVEEMTIKTLQRMFPDAVINLSGYQIVASQKNTGTVNGSMNNGTINHGQVACGCFDAMTDFILDSEELSGDEKVKMIKVLKKAKK